MWLPVFPFRKWCEQKEKQEIEKLLVLPGYIFSLTDKINSKDTELMNLERGNKNEG